MTTVQDKLKKWCPPYYKAVWNGNPNEPIRFKINDQSLSIKTLNMVWAEVLSEMTKSKHIDNGDYIRIHTNFGKHTIAISIYQTGTVMFQGTAVLGWVNRYVVQICKKVTAIINKPGLFLNNKDSNDIISMKEISIFGLCMLCNKVDNDEMLQCEDPGCGAWTHNKCENLTEEEARNLSPYCCIYCRNLQQSKSDPPSEKSSLGSTFISAPSHTKTNLEISSHSKPHCELDADFVVIPDHPISKNDRSPRLTQVGFQNQATKYLSVSLPPPILEDSNNFDETRSQSLNFQNCFDFKFLTDSDKSLSPSPVLGLDNLNSLGCANTDKQATSTPKEKNPKIIFPGSTSTINTSFHETPSSFSSQLNSNNVSHIAANDQDAVLSRLKGDVEPTLSITQAIIANTYLQERISKLLEENLNMKNLLHKQASEKEELKKIIETQIEHQIEQQIFYEEFQKNFDKVRAEKDKMKEEITKLHTENDFLKQQNTEFQLELAIGYCEIDKLNDLCDEINNILNPSKHKNSTIMINDDDYITRSHIISHDVDKSILILDNSQGDGVSSQRSNGVNPNKTFIKAPKQNFSTQNSKIFYRKDFNSQKYENCLLEFENLKGNKDLQKNLGLNKSFPDTIKTTQNAPLVQTQKKICWYAMHNRCKFGDKHCFNFHPPKNNEVRPANNHGSFSRESYRRKNDSNRNGLNQKYQQPQYPGNPIKTYSSVVRGSFGGGVGSYSAPSSHQMLPDRYPSSSNPVEYSDLMGGYGFCTRAQLGRDWCGNAISAQD